AQMAQPLGRDYAPGVLRRDTAVRERPDQCPLWPTLRAQVGHRDGLKVYSVNSWLGAPDLAERAFREFSFRSAGHSGLMFAARITLPHFSVSSAMSLPKSAGETTSGVTPKTASRAFILGSARPALISLLSLSTMSAGVFLGMPTPYQLLAS